MRQKLKSILEPIGVLAIYRRIRSFYSGVFQINWIDLGEGLKYYLYNHWFTYFPYHQLRLFYLRHIIGISIGKDTFIHMGCFFEGNTTFIGNNTVIGRNCYIGSNGGRLTIKNNVSITAQTYIFCSTHLVNSPVFETITKDTTIEDYAWIGARAMILPGVKIGKGSVLGAASTATKDIPDYLIYAGSPAKKIGERNKDLIYKLQYFPSFQ